MIESVKRAERPGLLPQQQARVGRKDRILLMIEILHYLIRTLNYGIFLITGNAGFISSAVSPSKFRPRPTSWTSRASTLRSSREALGK